MDARINVYINQTPLFSTKDFFSMLDNNEINVSRATAFNYLKQLSADNKIIKTSRCSYSCLVKESYHYDLSETAKNISLSIQKRFPLVNYQIWELYQINEFVNHQMAHNTIFVDVENELEESIFNFLFEDYQHVLFKPTFNEYYKYSKDETIVVKKLISESPSFVNEYHQASLEKILVDLFGKGISGSIISQSEYKAIYEDCFKKYQINTSALFRYARRRGNNKTIMKFIEENTNIRTLNQKGLSNTTIIKVAV